MIRIPAFIYDVSIEEFKQRSHNVNKIYVSHWLSYEERTQGDLSRRHLCLIK